VVGAGDFNQDGQADLVWENSVTGQREIWLINNGVPTTAINLGRVGTNWHIAGTGDFIGTGQASLVWGKQPERKTPHLGISKRATHFHNRSAYRLHGVEYRGSLATLRE